MAVSCLERDDYSDILEVTRVMNWPARVRYGYCGSQEGCAGYLQWSNNQCSDIEVFLEKLSNGSQRADTRAPVGLQARRPAPPSGIKHGSSVPNTGLGA
jgi:hypothetical protein